MNLQTICYTPLCERAEIDGRRVGDFRRCLDFLHLVFPFCFSWFASTFSNNLSSVSASSGAKAAPSARPTQPPPEPGPVNAAPGATVVQVTNTITREASRPIVLDLGDARPKSAGTALILSILICGLGQLYNGQVGKGIGMFVLCVALWFVFLGWIINIWSWIDAYQTAKRMNDRYLRLLASGAAV